MPDDHGPDESARVPSLALVRALRARLADLSVDATVVAVASLSPPTRARLRGLLEGAAEPSRAAREQLAGELDSDSLDRVMQWLEASRAVRRLLAELERRLGDGDRD